MKSKNVKTYFVSAIIMMMLLTLSCKEKEVIITKDYVINPNWSEGDNSFGVCKMLLKDSSKTIDLKDPAETELYYGLIEDTSFSFVTNVKYDGENFAKRKVYFNRDNGFSWSKSPNLDHNWEKYKTVGALQKETWYLLSGLSQIHTTMYYVYIDTLDSLHVFKVGTMTNY